MFTMFNTSYSQPHERNSPPNNESLTTLYDSYHTLLKYKQFSLRSSRRFPYYLYHNIYITFYRSYILHYLLPLTTTPLTTYYTTY